MIIDEPHKLFPRDKVDAAAAELEANDPDWTYRPNHCPNGTGYSFIEIFDENGEFVSRF